MPNNSRTRSFNESYYFYAFILDLILLAVASLPFQYEPRLLLPLVLLCHFLLSGYFLLHAQFFKRFHRVTIVGLVSLAAFLQIFFFLLYITDRVGFRQLLFVRIHSLLLIPIMLSILVYKVKAILDSKKITLFHIFGAISGYFSLIFIYACALLSVWSFDNSLFVGTPEFIQNSSPFFRNFSFIANFHISHALWAAMDLVNGGSTKLLRINSDFVSSLCTFMVFVVNMYTVIVFSVIAGNVGGEEVERL